MDESPYRVSWMLPALLYLPALGLAIAALAIGVGLNQTVAELRALVNGQTDPEVGIFSPSKTLFVAKGWKDGYDPPTHFTDIGSALTAALALGPTSDDPLQIIVYTGTYEENVVLISNVYITGLGDDTVIDGAVSWLAGTGANSVADEDSETVEITGMTIASLSVNTTGKPSFVGTRATFKTIDCTILDPASIVLRGNDISHALQTTYSRNVLYSSGRSFVRDSIFIQDVTASNGVILQLFGVSVEADLIALADTGVVLVPIQTYMGSAIRMGNNTLMVCSESELDGVLLTDTTSIADILSCNYQALQGTGRIERRLFAARSDTTLLGANTVNLAPPYFSTEYKVYFTQISGLFADPPILLTKSLSSFTFDSPEAGLIYDVLVVHQ